MSKINITNTVNVILVFHLLFYQVELIYLNCANNSTDCSVITSNAFCNTHGYCECQSGFINDCNTNALLLDPNATSPISNVSLQYFYVVPRYIGSYMQMIFDIQMISGDILDIFYIVANADIGPSVEFLWDQN
jgi:hypothetical protein